MSQHPLSVTVTWIDACVRHLTHVWDGTQEAIEKIGRDSGLYENRQTDGRLTFFSLEKLILSHDYDEDEGEVGHDTVIPWGWVTKVKTAKGKVIYVRDV